MYPLLVQGVYSNVQGSQRSILPASSVGSWNNAITAQNSFQKCMTRPWQKNVTTPFTNAMHPHLKRSQSWRVTEK
jgi:hypothetical protein